MKNRALTLRNNREVLPESSLPGVRKERKRLKGELRKMFITPFIPLILRGIFKERITMLRIPPLKSKRGKGSYGNNPL